MINAELLSLCLNVPRSMEICKEDSYTESTETTIDHVYIVNNKIVVFKLHSNAKLLSIKTSTMLRIAEWKEKNIKSIAMQTEEWKAEYK